MLGVVDEPPASCIVVHYYVFVLYVKIRYKALFVFLDVIQILPTIFVSANFIMQSIL